MPRHDRSSHPRLARARLRLRPLRRLGARPAGLRHVGRRSRGGPRLGARGRRVVRGLARRATASDGPAPAGPELEVVEEIPTRWVGDEEINPLFGRDRDAPCGGRASPSASAASMPRGSTCSSSSTGWPLPSTGAGAGSPAAGATGRSSGRPWPSPATSGSAEIWLVRAPRPGGALQRTRPGGRPARLPGRDPRLGDRHAPIGRRRRAGPARHATAGARSGPRPSRSGGSSSTRSTTSPSWSAASPRRPGAGPGRRPSGRGRSGGGGRDPSRAAPRAAARP